MCRWCLVPAGARLDQVRCRNRHRRAAIVAEGSVYISAWHISRTLEENETFDAVIMLAVVEHVSHEVLTTWATAVPTLTEEHGRLIITVPAPVVDRILDVGIRLRLLHGMDTANHHGFDPRVVPQGFADSFDAPRQSITIRTWFEPSVRFRTHITRNRHSSNVVSDTSHFSWLYFRS